MDTPLEYLKIRWFDRVKTVEVEVDLSCELCEQIKSLKHLKMFRLRGKLYEEWEAEPSAEGPQCVAQLETHSANAAE